MTVTIGVLSTPSLPLDVIKPNKQAKGIFDFFSEKVKSEVTWNIKRLSKKQVNTYREKILYSTLKFKYLHLIRTFGDWDWDLGVSISGRYFDWQ